MPSTPRKCRKVHRRRLRALTRLALEGLEARSLPAGFTWTASFPAVAEVEPNETLDQAQDLQDITPTASGRGQVGVVGTIANTTTGGGVDWYKFSLSAPADVHLTTLDRAGGSGLVSVLSLYNYDAFDFNDHFDIPQHRLLAQDDGAARGGDAVLDRLLGAGTYFVAVSGSGNTYFHPFLAASGYPGSTGDYGLAITATSAGIAPTDGPAVLTVDPAPGSVLAQSPYVVRVDLSQPLDPGSFIATGSGPGQTVELRYNPQANDFSPGHYVDVPITPNFTPNTSSANELQMVLGAPLAPGYYQVFLAGNGTGGASVLTTPADPVTGNVLNLGQNGQDPNGADFTSTFQVNGIEGEVGATGPSDTIATAHELNDITASGLVQRVGAVGVDPTDTANPFDPGAVQVYHFALSGQGRYAFTAEVFAGRIGSPLNPAVTLFRKDADGSLHLVGLNDDTNNGIVASDGSGTPLLSDAALFAGLTAGDYYVVVSSSPNYPDPTQSWQPGTQANGSFDPATSQSTNLGLLVQSTNRTPNVGPYVLNLSVAPDNVAPTVVSVTPAAGATLATPPTQLTVQFSEPVDLIALANQAFVRTNTAVLNAVYVQGPDGTQYYPRIQSFDPTSNTATFLMLDGLANGTYQMHLSGTNGLTDFAGNPLVGNDPSHDYVVSFTVNGPARGVNGNPLQWAAQGGNHTLDNPRDLGVLFPKELAQVTTLPGGSTVTGVTVTRDFSQLPATDPADTVDYYRVQLLQGQNYTFLVNGLNLPPGVQPILTLWDSNQVQQGTPGTSVQGQLAPGVCLIGVDWGTSGVSSGQYQLTIALSGASDNPPPLTSGPGPAIRIRLATDSPPQSPPPQSPPQNPPPAAPSTPPDSSSSSTPPSSSSGNPPPTPPANTVPPQTPQASSPPVDSSSPPPVSAPPASSPPPSTPPASSPSASTPVVSLPPSVPPPPPRLTLPPAPSGDASTGGNAVASNSSPTANGLVYGPSAPAAGGSLAVATGGISFSGFGTIPSSLLTSLGAGPAGGVQTYGLSIAATFTPERVVVQGVNPVNVDGFVRITTLTQPGQNSGTDARVSLEGKPVNQAPDGSLKAPPAAVRQILDWLERALDAFFGTGEWSARSAGSPNGAFGDGDPDPMADGLGMAPARTALPDHLADEAWVAAAHDAAAGWSRLLAAVAVLGFAGAPRTRYTPRPALWVRPEETN